MLDSDIALSYLAGVATITVAAPFVEWYIHKAIMHIPKPNRDLKKADPLIKTIAPVAKKYIVDASVAHDDNHHGAYKGPSHYYRDDSNHDAVLHFSKKDIGAIVGLSTAVGTGISAVFNAITQQPQLLNGAFIAGTSAASFAYYAAYEISHHYMHVITERRHEISHELGELIEKEPGSESLRFSKPFLDDMCNEIERAIDKNYKNPKKTITFSPQLVQTFQEQLRVNEDVTKNDIDETIFYQLTDIMLQKEREKRASLKPLQKIQYLIDRNVQRICRHHKGFEKVDYHHFLHHYRRMNNLNVVWPIADRVLKTHTDSSRAVLNKPKRFWLCPNPN